MNNLKGVIFDFDGTIVDSMPYWNNIVINYLKQNGIKNIDNALLDKINSMHLEESAEFISKNILKNKIAKEIKNEILEILMEQYKNHFNLKEGIKDVLELLKNNNIKMCIASSGVKNVIIECCKRLAIYDYFEFIITADEIGRGKQFPDIYLQSTEKLNLHKNEVIIIEDSLYAIETAKKNNFYVIAIEDTESIKDKEKLMSIADKYLTNFKDFKLN